MMTPGEAAFVVVDRCVTASALLAAAHSPRDTDDRTLGPTVRSADASRRSCATPADYGARRNDIGLRDVADSGLDGLAEIVGDHDDWTPQCEIRRCRVQCSGFCGRDGRRAGWR